jgi:predicted membrane channel-forming protein YqfA (hemolysin III family)
MSTERLVFPSSSPWHARLLVALATLLALLLWWHGPVAQWASYHAFADRRAWLGIANAADVLSNLPFALIGMWGLLRLAAPQRTMPARAAWQVFFAALVCTAAGSAFYHLAPDNAALVADRLPIAWACAALLCAFLAERVNPRWAGVPVVAAALVAATAAVLYWWFTEQRGAGDLRPYLYVQFLPMLLIPATLLLRPMRIGTAVVTPSSAWWAVLALYAAAKGMELADHAVFDALGAVSGHTLKHLLAAAAAGVIVRAAVSCGSRR